MKKVIVLIISLFLISSAYAITLDELTPGMVDDLTNEEVASLIAEYNSLDENGQDYYVNKYEDWEEEDKVKLMEKIPDLEESVLESQFEFFEKEINENLEVPDVPMVFPLKIKFDVLDTDDSLVLIISQDGLKITDEQPDINLGISSTALTGFSDGVDFLTLIEESEVKPVSVKGAFVLNAFENIFKEIIVKERTFGYKFIGVFAKPVSWFVKDVEVN